MLSWDKEGVGVGTATGLAGGCERMGGITLIPAKITAAHVAAITSTLAMVPAVKVVAAVPPNPGIEGTVPTCGVPDTEGTFPIAGGSGGTIGGMTRRFSSSSSSSPSLDGIACKG